MNDKQRDFAAREDYLALRSQLLVEKMMHLKVRVSSRYFSRAVFILLMFFLIWVERTSALTTVTVIVGGISASMWLFEALSTERSIQLINYRIANIERRLFDEEFADIHAKHMIDPVYSIKLRLYSRTLLFEPIVWFALLNSFLYPTIWGW